MQFARHSAPADEKMTATRAAVTAMLTVSGASDWREADAASQQAVASAKTDLERLAIEQSTANLMLTGFLSGAPNDPDAADAALRYARRMVELESPQTEAVLAAVETFQTRWTEAETRSVATGAAQALSTYVAEGGSCADCDRPADAERTLAHAGMGPDVYAARQLDASARLTALVAN